MTRAEDLTLIFLTEIAWRVDECSTPFSLAFPGQKCLAVLFWKPCWVDLPLWEVMDADPGAPCGFVPLSAALTPAAFPRGGRFS